MTLTLQVNEFGALATSGTLDDAVREPDFMKRANRLFSLRERVWDAFDNTKAEIEKETKKEAKAKARRPGLIGAFLGAVAGAVGVLLLAGTLAPIALGVAAVGAAILGFTGQAVAHVIWERGPAAEGEEAQNLLEYSRKNMHTRIETEIKRMDNSLFSQKPEVRDEFRSAFRHAATKQEARENRIHRAKVEAEAAEAADNARSAVALASIAAMTAAMSSMSRSR